MATIDYFINQKERNIIVYIQEPGELPGELTLNIDEAREMIHFLVTSIQKLEGGN